MKDEGTLCISAAKNRSSFRLHPSSFEVIITHHHRYSHPRRFCLLTLDVSLFGVTSPDAPETSACAPSKRRDV